MLVLTRRIRETIWIGDEIEIVVTRIDFDRVRVAIRAPREIAIYRGELYQEIKKLDREIPITSLPTLKE